MRPTRNLAAYDAYLKGLEITNQTGDPIVVRQGMSHFERAVALDTGYAGCLGRRLSQAASFIVIVGFPTPALSSGQRSRAERSLALAPDHPEAHLAMGEYPRRVEQDYAGAIDDYSRGERLSPSTPSSSDGVAMAEQSLGRWDAALEPPAPGAAAGPAVGARRAKPSRRRCWVPRRYDEAQASADRGSLSPRTIRWPTRSRR